MSNALIEKRNEMLATKAALVADRQAKIDSQVAAYREALEAQMPIDEIKKLDDVINALNAVIAYDSANTIPVQPTVEVEKPTVKAVEAEVVSEVKAEESTVEDIPVEQAVETTARPGMSEILTPNRS